MVHITHLTRGIEVGVIHGDICGIGGVLVDERVAAIATIDMKPASIRLLEFRSVVLCATNHELAVQGMQRQALELSCAEACRIAAGPCLTAVARTPDATIAALIHDGIVGRRINNYMCIGVERCVWLSKSIATVDGLLQRRATSLSAQKESVGIIGLEGDYLIIETLAGTKTSCRANGGRPACPPVRGEINGSAIFRCGGKRRDGRSDFIDGKFYIERLSRQAGQRGGKRRADRR